MNEKVFNKKIADLIKNNSTSKSATFIKKIQTIEELKSSNYSFMLDELGHLAGFKFFLDELIDKKSGKLIGYIPTLEYVRNNSLGEEPRNIVLSTVFSPSKFDAASQFLAKELLYKLVSLGELNLFVEKNCD